MADPDVEIPKVGNVPKKVLIPVVLAAVGFVGWRYWQSRNGTGADAGTDTTASDFADGGTVPGVLGAVSPTNSYGSGDTGNTTDTTGPGNFTNNAQWTDYVVSKLTTSDTWTYTDIVTAIGNALAGKPLSTLQQSIVRAAIAIGGQPPQGSISIVPGGDAVLTVPPGNVRLVSVTGTSATIGFDPVAGAVRYTVYRSGGGASSVGIGTTSPVTISGLTPNTSYTMNVAGETASGTDGPRSSSITVKTPATALKAPARPTATKVISNAVVVKTSAVAGATLYRWYLNGSAVSTSQAPSATIAPLHSKTTYKISVKAGATGQPDGPVSSSLSVKTK
jgi:hypothetical protein